MNGPRAKGDTIFEANYMLQEAAISAGRGHLRRKSGRNFQGMCVSGSSNFEMAVLT